MAKPKMPRTPKTASAQKLYEWALRKYFEYIDEKKKIGGFPTEWRFRIQSEVKFAPDLDAAILRAELADQIAMTIWANDPVRRPPDASSGDDAASERVSGATDPPPEAEAPSKARREAPAFSEPDLFSVAGVSMPASFTIPDLNVPEGYRRVGRRWGTYRIYELHVKVEEAKAQEAVAAAEQSR